MTRQTALELIRRHDIHHELADARRPLTEVDRHALVELEQRADREQRGEHLG